MPLFSETEDKIFGDVLFDVVNDTNITRVSPGTKTRALVEAMSKKMGRMYQKFDINVAQAFINGAEGKYLDFIANTMGVFRLGEEPARINSVERNVKFFVDVGTFGDINGGNSISIPTGTIISTLVRSKGIKYRTPYDVVLPASASSAYIPAEAITSGTRSNVGKGQLRFHDYNGYTDSSNESLKITNDGEVVSGKSIESDTNLKFRTVNQILSSEMANEMAIRLAALSVPGVADITINPFAKGIGTFDILVHSISPSVPLTLVDAVRESISKVVAMGVVGNVRKPTETGVSLLGTLRYKRVLTVEEESNILASATRNVTVYINNLDIGEDLIVNEMVERVMATSDLVKNIGVANNPFEAVYIYKSSRLEDNKVRSEVLGDFTPKIDEKLLIEQEQAGLTPILLRSV